MALINIQESKSDDMSTANALQSSSFTTIDPHANSGGEETLPSNYQPTGSMNALDPTSKIPMVSSSVKCMSKYGNLDSRFHRTIFSSSRHRREWIICYSSIWRVKNLYVKCFAISKSRAVMKACEKMEKLHPQKVDIIEHIYDLFFTLEYACGY